jgi:hypothetical protein
MGQRSWEVVYLPSGWGIKMKRSLFMLVLFFTLSLSSLHVYAGDIDRYCVTRGYQAELECNVSMAILIAHGDEFNGKVIVITGYFANGPMPMLFASSEDFSTSNVVNGIAVRVSDKSKIVSRLFDLDHHLITIRGRYDMKPVNLTDYTGSKTSGSISDIQAVGDAYSPWGYTGTNPPPTVKP